MISATSARRAAAALSALALTGCVTSQSTYDELQTRYEQTQAANRKLQSDNAALQAQLVQQTQQNMIRNWDAATSTGRAITGGCASRDWNGYRWMCQ